MKTQVMAILNLTPDSFFQKSRFENVEDAITQAILFEQQGADILDLGAESSRPGSDPITFNEELERLIPVLEGLRGQVTIPLSIDTTKPEVAEKVLSYGISLLNDISGFEDPLMAEIAASHQVDLCVMHMLGKPKTMQINPFYENGVVFDLIRWFEKKIESLLSRGVKKERIILDPGIGFGKTVADNLKIIQNLPMIHALGFRVLLGLSRKTFIQKLLRKSSNDALFGTLGMNAIAILKGVDIIRVHDVKEHRDLVDIVYQYQKINKNN